MGAIFFKELKDARVPFWSIVVGLVAAVLLPNDLGQCWMVFLGWFLVPMFCAYMGSRVLSADLSDEQLPFILTLPISRTQLWLARASAGGALTLIASLGVMAVAQVLFGTPWWHLEVKDCALIGLMYGLAYAIAASLSVVFDRPLTAAFLAYTSGVLGLMVHAVLLDMRWLRSHVHTGPAVAYTSLTVLAIGLVLASLWVFRTADLLDRRDRTWRTLASIARVLFLVEALFWGWLLITSS